jgi:TonB family protein
MESPEKKLSRFLEERDPASPEFWRGVRSSFRPAELPATALSATALPGNDNFDLWRDVFVQQKLPWGRFLQSALLHTAAVALIWTISLSWIRQQRILDRATFDQSSLVTYSPEEYLPPLDTGVSLAPKAEDGDPAYARQPILSVPPEADNRSQTIVVPPDLKLDRDVALPNIVATGAIVPAVPLDATRSSMSRMVVPETQVVAPAPEVQFARDRVVQAAMKSDVIAPPPEVTNHHTQGLAGPETAVVEPPPELTQPSKSHVGPMNIGPSQVVAPAPQLTLAEQHSLPPRGSGRLPGGGMQPVGPPPSVTAAGGARAGGRMIALGIHPVAPNGPVPVPGGNRRGTFAATPLGKPGAAGTPDLAGSKSGAKGSRGRSNGSLPTGLQVGAADFGATSPVERNGRASSNGNANGNSDGNRVDDPRQMASLSTPGTRASARPLNAVPDDRVTDVDRQVFGVKRFYEMALNMPNLNSSTGSWVIRFAELQAGHNEGELLAPVATEKSDPGYPLELIHANVHGVVTLYAVIHSDGKVSDIRVLNSPDERLDSYAAQALARWKFLPAVRAGKPVALEAVVVIPFRVRRNF